MDQMAFAKKWRRRRQNSFKPRSGDCKKRRDVVSAGGGETDDRRIDDLFTSKPRLGNEPPHSRMKPEHGGYDFLDQDDERVLSPDMKQFVPAAVGRGT